MPLKEIWSFQPVFPPQPAWRGEAKLDGYNKVFDMKARQTFDHAFHPIIVGSRVYFGSSSSDKIYCLDALTGRQQWVFYAEGPIRLAPTHHGERLFVGSDDGRVYCLDPVDGRLIWEARPGPSGRRIPGNGRLISNWPIRTSLVVMDGQVYGSAGMFPSEGVYLFCLDAQDGTINWVRKNTDLPAQGYLLASPTRLYVPAGRSNPVVYDRANGDRLRVVSGQGGTYCLLTGDTLVFGPGKTGVLGLIQPESSDQLASFTGNHMIVTPSVSYLHGDSEISALDRSRYLRLAEERNQLKDLQTQAVRRLRDLEDSGDNDEVQGTLRERLTAVADRIDGIGTEMVECEKWSVACDHPFALTLAGDVLYTGGENSVSGNSVVDGRSVWEATTKGDVYGIAVGSGVLIASTHEGYLHAFSTK